MDENSNYDVDILEENAANGDKESVKKLIDAYENGIGVEKDQDIAERWKKWAIEHSVISENEVVDDENLKHEDSAEVEINTKIEWDQYKAAYEKMSFLKLKKLQESDDSTAMLVMGEKYLESAIDSEKKNGIELIKRSIRSFQGNTMSNLNRYALIEAWTKIGNYYCERYWLKLFNSSQNGDNDLSDYGNKAFEAFSNVAELDPGNVEGLIDCYENGIGCEKDEETIDRLKRAKAERGGFREKYDYANSLKEGSILKIEMYQEALAAADADNHPYLKAKAREFLATHFEPDEKGESIDLVKEWDNIEKIAAEGTDRDYLDYQIAEKENQDKLAKEKKREEEQKLEEQRREEEQKLEEQRKEEEQKLEEQRREEEIERQRNLQEEKVKRKKKIEHQMWIGLLVISFVFVVGLIVFSYM